jgi:thioredoxin-like negative regulator of GroEL
VPLDRPELVAEPSPTGAGSDSVAETPAPHEDESDDTSDQTPDEVAGALAEARALTERGQSLRAFHQLRDLGARRPEDPRVLRAWSELALSVRSFGEAHRIARRWARCDDSIEAHLHLARMERTVGNTERAIAVLTALLERHPTCGEARELARMYGGEARLAHQ